MKDCICSRVYMMPAVFAGILAARFYRIMTCNLLTIIAENTIGVAKIFQPFKTSIIIWEVCHELL